MQKINGGCGKAFKVSKGLNIKIINTHGSQVVDTWAFNVNEMGEFLSTQHNRSCLEKLTPSVGDYNFKMALSEIGFKVVLLPSPWNIFENVVEGESKSLKIQSPPVKAGDYVLLRAEMDLIMILSSCPMDIALTNGPDGIPKEIEYQII